MLEFFAAARVRSVLAALEAAGVRLDEPATPGGTALQGQTYVITGTLPTLSRAEAKARLEQAGARVTESVSKKTTAVVVGADPGTKAEKAQRLGVPTIDEAELLRRVTRSA